jgi:hypothetical protein
MKKFREFISESVYDFKQISGPRNNKVVGGIAGARGKSPEDAIKQRFISFGYKVLKITTKAGIIKAEVSFRGTEPTEIQYYKVERSM